jgi:hypothetical protein
MRLGRIVLVLLSCACGDDTLDGMQFESEEQVEMGLGPNGAVMGRASLSFEAGRYSWKYSDLDCVGPYSLDDGEVTAETSIPCSQGTIKGRWDSGSGVLTWAQGKRYRRK